MGSSRLGIHGLADNDAGPRSRNGRQDKKRRQTARGFSTTQKKPSRLVSTSRAFSAFAGRRRKKGGDHESSVSEWKDLHEIVLATTCSAVTV